MDYKDEFEGIDIEQLRKVLLLIEEQQEINNDIVVELKDSLNNHGYNYDELHDLIYLDNEDESKDKKVSYESAFLYNLINTLNYNTHLLRGYKPLFKQLDVLYNEVLKNKLNNGLDLDIK